MIKRESTTEEIREGFIESGLGDGSHMDQDDVRALNAQEFDAWIKAHDSEVEQAAAEKAWNRCVNEMPIDPDWKNFYGDNNPYRAAALGLTAGQEGKKNE